MLMRARLGEVHPPPPCAAATKCAIVSLPLESLPLHAHAAHAA